jgi:exodeoxyribonuclease V beta subunit
MTSYSRMKREAAERRSDGARASGRATERAALGPAGEGGGAVVDADEAPASAAIDEAPADEAAPAEGALPGGAEIGVFLHEILEKLPLAPFSDGDDLARFRARPEVASIVSAALHKHDVPARHRDEVERLVWAAFATRIVAPPRPGATDAPSLPRGLGAATRALRELELVYPFPSPGEALAAAPRAEAPRGYVRSIIDLLAESDGRVWLVDWKSDLLPSYEPAAVAAHVDAHYRLQLRLYAVGLARLLGARGPAELDARLGGVAYVFLRGLPAPGAIATLRPTWDELSAWLEEIAQMGPGGDA